MSGKTTPRNDRRSAIVRSARCLSYAEAGESHLALKNPELDLAQNLFGPRLVRRFLPDLIVDLLEPLDRIDVVRVQVADPELPGLNSFL